MGDVNAEYDRTPPFCVPLICRYDSPVSLFDIDRLRELRFYKVAVPYLDLVQINVSPNPPTRDRTKPALPDHLLDAARIDDVLKDLSQRFTIATTWRSRESHEEPVALLKQPKMI